VLAEDLQSLMSIGFSKQQAVNALKESGYDVEAAANWLIMNCI
jgi:hypothetical protein